MQIEFRPAAFLLTAILAILTFSVAASRVADAQDDSQARVVRLSFVEGTVGILTPGSSEWAQASINTPIEEGYELVTQKDSFAEIQFENASTVRLGELSSILFDKLTVSDPGRRVTRVNFEKGYGTVHLFSDPSAQFEVTVGDSTITPEDGCEFRIDRDDHALRIEVWSGGLNFSGPLGSIELGQNQVLTYVPDSGEPYDIQSSLTPDDWDRWVVGRDQTEASRPESVTPVNYGGVESNNLYGWSDLSNLGSWNYYADVGYAWCPHVSTGWVPYSFGRWVWYPGFGYTWVSFEPWGWLPYHYGQWIYESGSGWAWAPRSFANWSPALVNWYQGPGWVGWTPQMPGILPGGGIPCPSLAQGCMRALSVNKFQNGVSVTPQAILKVNSWQGRNVRRVDLPATPLAMLPGTPLARPAAAPVGLRPGGMAPAQTSSSGGPTPSSDTAGKVASSNHFRPRFKTGEAPAVTHQRRAPSAPPAIGGRSNPVPHPHFNGSTGPWPVSLPSAMTSGGSSGAPVSPAGVHPASIPAPAVPRAAFPR